MKWDLEILKHKIYERRQIEYLGAIMDKIGKIFYIQ